MIIADFRERESGVPEKLRRLGIEVVEDTLEVGDYRFGDICVERKTITDYIQSKDSGHLDRQLADMSHNFELSYLVVVGYVSTALMKMKCSRNSYLSSLFGSSLKRAVTGLKGQVITVNVETEMDLVWGLKFLHDKVEAGDFARLPRIKKKSFNSDDVLVFILSSFPNIGLKRSKLILKRVKTLKRFANSDAGELGEIIPKKYAGEVYRLLNLVYGGE